MVKLKSFWCHYNTWLVNTSDLACNFKYNLCYILKSTVGIFENVVLKHEFTLQNVRGGKL